MSHLPRPGRKLLLLLTAALLSSTAACFDLLLPPFAGSAFAADASAHSGEFDLGPESVWIQVESHPDIETTLQRARALSASFEHTHAFLSESGWYAITIGVVDRSKADEVLVSLISSGAIPRDSLATGGQRYLAMVWPRDSAAATTTLDAAISREKSWPLSTRRGVQNALIWTGDYNGVLDGEFGPKTRDAIRNFQRRNGFPATGYLTENEIDHLEDARVAAVSATGFQIVDDMETGIRVGFPAAIFSRAGRDDGFVDYQPRPGQPEGRLLLLSSLGSTSDLRALSDFLVRKGEFGANPYAVRRENWFVVSGTENGVTTYIYARTEYGALKGFLLSWPESASRTFGPIATAMYNSFEAMPGIVLQPEAVAAYPTIEDRSAHAGVGTSVGTGQTTTEPGRDREPSSTGTGFVVHRSGKVLTNAHVVEGCGEIDVAGFPATVTTADDHLDLAILQASGGDWSSVAAFAARPARLNSDVTVMGFPLHGLLSGLNVTRGSVSAQGNRI